MRPETEAHPLAGPGPHFPDSGIAVDTDIVGSAAAQTYAEVLVAKPPLLPWETAGGLTAAGQTARTCLIQLGVTSGDVLLVHAAAGGVGTITVQPARRLGARAIGTDSEGNHGYLRKLGAIPTCCGPGLTERVQALAPEGVDAALDLVGGASITTSRAVVRGRGRIGTTVDQHAVDEHGIRRVGGRSHTALRKVVALAGEGRLTLPVTAVPWLDSAHAHRLVENGHVRGKVVLML